MRYLHGTCLLVLVWWYHTIPAAAGMMVLVPIWYYYWYGTIWYGTTIPGTRYWYWYPLGTEKGFCSPGDTKISLWITANHKKIANGH